MAILRELGSIGTNAIHDEDAVKQLALTRAFNRGIMPQGKVIPINCSIGSIPKAYYGVNGHCTKLK